MTRFFFGSFAVILILVFCGLLASHGQAAEPLRVRMTDGTEVEVQALIDEVERTRPLVKGFRAQLRQQREELDKCRGRR